MNSTPPRKKTIPILLRNERLELQSILIEYVENPTRLGTYLMKAEELFRHVYVRLSSENEDPQFETMEEIVERISTKHNLPIAVICGPKRRQDILAARTELIVTLYKNGHTYKAISKLIGRTPSAVTHTLHVAGILDNSNYKKITHQ